MTARPAARIRGDDGVGSVLVIAPLVTASCSTIPTTAEPEAEMTARPSREQMLGRYEAVPREVVQVLGAEIGGLHQTADPVQMGASRSGCSTGGPVTEAQEVETIGLLAEGTDASAAWHRSAELVLDVGRRSGFDDTATVVDRPGHSEVVGADEYGAVFQNGTAVNTVLPLRTGCHLRADRPGSVRVWPLPIPGPFSTQVPTW